MIYHRILLTGGHLSCFLVLATVNSDAIHMGACVFLN